ncbi:hypothetical protein [Acanthopleuribacter pedis]|uniref:Uncharacterized protein n=1 Tax=Acanthopleuribacter pedis TaxID=442870 RepID=A0A8J7U1P0_9BACT|nr:hypothetical protein [Acanthopleuribacter pedis]MBO1318408.1 hypothetical protein [Acanthopleuribacter pedis]
MVKGKVGRRKVKRAPVVLLLHGHMVDHPEALLHWFQQDQEKTRHQIRYLYSLFAFKSEEGSFARDLVLGKPNFWVFRCNQKAFCGDFLVIDMSPPKVADRPVWLLDLKEGCPVSDGAGSAGAQMIHADRALAAIYAEHGAVEPNQPFEKRVGSAAALLEFFGCPVATLPSG